jgi:hypothetical protein
MSSDPVMISKDKLLFPNFSIGLIHCIRNKGQMYIV